MSEENKNIILDDEKHLVLDHDYDGIQELDHPLPSWWLATFWGAIVFAVPYLLYYTYADGPSLREEFAKSWRETVAVKAEAAKSLDRFDSEAYNAVVAADSDHAKGAAVYEENCAACHLEAGRGDIGPNLTDKYWLVAKGTPESIFDIVVNGSEENGMPPWGEVLEKEEILQVVSYVMSLKNTNHPEGKEPQGEAIEE